MTNPFEDEAARYLVLVNHEDRYSLWPADITVPDGWRRVFGEADRSACLHYVDRNFTVVQQPAQHGTE